VKDEPGFFEGFYYRYDTDAKCAVLNQLWRLVNDRLNYLTPATKLIAYATSRDVNAAASTTRQDAAGPLAGRRDPLTGRRCSCDVGAATALPPLMIPAESILKRRTVGLPAD
jgi:hypothetical protein